jgi:membrane protease YdiL (CAAX protease family)
MIDYPGPDPSLLSGTIAIATATLAFLVYIFTTGSERFGRGIRRKYSDRAAAVRRVLFQRVLGAIVYGLIPLLIMIFVFRRPMAQYGFSGDNLMKSFLWWMPLAVVVIILSNIAARSEKNLAMYPQIRVNDWNVGLLVVSALSWVTYLIGYEFFFRGYLLFSCLESFGYWPAIIINISLYSLFHIHKGSREAIGSIFFGFLMCYITLHLGSFWFAIFIHVTMALSNEWFSLGFQPEMNLIKNARKK